MKITLLILCIILCSCGPGAKLRRAEKLIAKAELMGAKWHVDTVYKDTTIFIPDTQIDTAYKYLPGVTDTVTVYRDNVMVRIIHRKDSIFVEAKCPDSLKIKKLPVAINKSIEAPPCKCPPWYYYLFAAAIGGVGALIFVAFRR